MLCPCDVQNNCRHVYTHTHIPHTLSHTNIQTNDNSDSSEGRCLCVYACVWSPMSNLRSTDLRGLHRKSIKLRYPAIEFMLLMSACSSLGVAVLAVTVVVVVEASSGRWKSLQHKTNIGEIPTQ